VRVHIFDFIDNGQLSLGGKQSSTAKRDRLLRGEFHYWNRLLWYHRMMRQMAHTTCCRVKDTQWTTQRRIKTGIFLTVHTFKRESEVFRLSQRCSWCPRYLGFSDWCPTIRNCQVALYSRVAKSDVHWTFWPLNTRPSRCIETPSSDTVRHPTRSKISWTVSY
jgi:hypothetical protein